MGVSGAPPGALSLWDGRPGHHGNRTEPRRPCGTLVLQANALADILYLNVLEMSIYLDSPGSRGGGGGIWCAC